MNQLAQGWGINDSEFRMQTENFFKTGKLAKKAGWQAISKVASRKLDMIDAAVVLADLKVPPNNRLEELKANLKGYHSIHINDQWRIVFK